MKHVTISGCELAPRRLPPGEVWNVNYEPEAHVLNRLTRSFQLHPARTWDPREARWVALCPVPLYVPTQGDTRQARHGRVYPIQRVPQGPFCSSFDYMMALAIHERFTSIHLAGVTLQQGTDRERLHEHWGLAYWIGVARGRGIRVTWDARCRMLHAPYRYGLQYRREAEWVERHILAWLLDHWSFSFLRMPT